MLNRFAILLTVFFAAAHPARLAAQGAVVWNGPLLTFSNAPGSLWYRA